MISSFNPNLLSFEDLDHLLVERQDVVDRALRDLREDVETGSRHHLLLVGPRGIGKTHLVSLVRHSLDRDPLLRPRLVLAWLREEEWGLTSFLGLLIRILRAIEEDLDEKIIIDEIYDLPAKRAQVWAEAKLIEVVGDRTLVLLAENLDDAFSKGLDEANQRIFRAFLQNHRLVSIVGTAKSIVEEISDHEAPFFGFFDIEYLKELSVLGAIDLLTRLARREDRPDLVTILSRPEGRARIRAVHTLAGGNPRIYVLLAQLLHEAPLSSNLTAFVGVVDKLTPYYQGLMERLSPQQRQVIETLAALKGSTTVSEIARRCFIDNPTTVSAQLRRLKDFGYVTVRSVGRERFYRLREPMMRLAFDVKGHGPRPIESVVELLALFYTSAELKDLIDSSLDDRERTYYLEAREIHSALHGQIQEEDRHDLAEYRRLASEHQDAEIEKMARAKTLSLSRGIDFWFLGYSLARRGAYVEARPMLRRSLEDHPANWVAWSYLAATELQLGLPAQALTSSTEAIRLITRHDPLSSPRHTGAFLHHAQALLALGRFEDAYGWTSALCAADSTWSNAFWEHSSTCLLLAGRQPELGARFLNEAAWSAALAIEMDPFDPRCWANFGEALLYLEGPWHAVFYYLAALQIDDDTPPFDPRHVRRPAVDLRAAQCELRLGLWREGMLRTRGFLSDIDRSTAISAAEPVVAALADVLESDYFDDRANEAVRTFHDFDLHEVFSTSLITMIGDWGVRPVGFPGRWLAAWRRVLGEDRDLERPLRILEAAVEAWQVDDVRSLLRLPDEERAMAERGLERGRDLRSRREAAA